MPPTSLRTVDLDLLAGPGYAGSWTVSSSNPVAYTAASDGMLSHGTTPSATWFLSRASGSLGLSNPSARPVRVDVTWYGRAGKRRAGTPISVPARGAVRWAPKIVPRESAVLQATAPVAATGSGSEPVSRLLSNWYVVATRLSHVVLFNPDSTAARADVRFIGSKTVTGQQVRIAAGRSFSLPTHGARAVVVTATRPVALDTRGDGPRLPQLMYQPSTSAALTSAGQSTRITVFNPSDRPAHLAYTLVSRSSAAVRETLVAPRHVVDILARRVDQAARGVIVRSDVPVVAAPAN